MDLNNKSIVSPRTAHFIGIPRNVQPSMSHDFQKTAELQSSLGVIEFSLLGTFTILKLLSFFVPMDSTTPIAHTFT